MRLPPMPDRRRRRSARASNEDATPDPVDDEELLATPLDDQDLDDRLAAAGDRARARSTKILISVALIVFGFAAGASTGRSAAEMSAAIAEQQADVDGAVPGFEPEPGLRGTVRVIDGASLYVELEDRTVVHVELSPTTSVSSIIDAHTEDLTPGTPVRVFGDHGEAGVFRADEVIGLRTPDPGGTM